MSAQAGCRKLIHVPPGKGNIDLLPVEGIGAGKRNPETGRFPADFYWVFDASISDRMGRIFVRKKSCNTWRSRIVLESDEQK